MSRSHASVCRQRVYVMSVSVQRLEVFCREGVVAISGATASS